MRIPPTHTRARGWSASSRIRFGSCRMRAEAGFCPPISRFFFESCRNSEWNESKVGQAKSDSKTSPSCGGSPPITTGSRSPVALPFSTVLGPPRSSATTPFRRSRGGSGAARERDGWPFRHRCFPQKESAGEDRGDLEIASFQFEEEGFPEQDVKSLISRPGRHHHVSIVRDAP